MEWLLWTLASLALLVAWSARKTALALRDRVDQARREATSRVADADELKTELAGLRKLMAMMAAGHEVDALMVRENRLYRNTRAEAIQEAVAAGERLYVLDVRTDQEWATGHIPGAVHVPIEVLEGRLSEVKRDGTPMYVLCAAGGRSSAAAEFLSNRGFLNVWNVEGGMNAWRGEVVRD